MCMDLLRFCFCGRNSAYLSYRDDLLPAEILINLFCPECRPDSFGEDCVLQDCGWALEYDVERAQDHFNAMGISGQATPEFIFDEGYLSWQGLHPADQEIHPRLHQGLAPLIKRKLTHYLQSLHEEWEEHVARHKAAGWRKAQAF